MKGVNLIPAPRLLARHRRVRLRWWLAAGATYGGILLLVYVGCWVKWNTGGHLDNSEMAEVSRQIDARNRRIAAVRTAASQIEAKIETHRAVGNQPDWSILLALLARSLGDDLVLKHCRLALEPIGPPAGVPGAKPSPEHADPHGRREFILEVTGLGRTQTAVSQYVLRLEQARLFDYVKLVKTSREKFLSGKAVAFRIECALGANSRGI